MRPVTPTITLFSVLAALLTAGSFACTPEAEFRTNTSADADGDCVEGRRTGCTCGDSTGVRVCESDGTFGPCRCGGDVDIGPGDRDTRSDRLDDDASDARLDPDADAADGDGGGDPSRGIESVRATSRFERSVSPPDCDAADDEVKIIDESSDWNDLNADQYRVFCVRPGDYRGAAQEGDDHRLKFTAAGTEERPRYVVYDGPTEDHPVEQAPEDRAIVDGLRVEDGASHWIVSGLRVDVSGNGGPRTFPISISAKNVTLDRLLSDGPGDEFVNTLIMRTWDDRTTLQNSVFRNLLQGPDEEGRDRFCVVISGDNRGSRIVSNELYDCTDGIHMPPHADDHRFDGTIIAHNDMYITPRYFSDGDGNRGSKHSGDYTCAENAVDIKKGSEDPENPVEVIGNRMWHFSDADQECGGSGTGKQANAITIHNGAKNDGLTEHIRVRNNVIFDTEGGVAVGQGNNVDIANNLFHSYGWRGADSGFESGDGFGILYHSSEDFGVDHAGDVTGNTFVDGKNWSRIASQIHVGANVFVDGGAVNPASYEVDPDTDGNAYYGDSEPWEDNPAIERPNASDAEMEEFCVTLRGYTDPRERCVPNAVRSEPSPHGAEKGFDPPIDD